MPKLPNGMPAAQMISKVETKAEVEFVFKENVKAQMPNDK